MVLYSKNLEPDEREKLIDFVEAYINSMAASEVNETAEAAKQKAKELLETDVDILVFVVTAAMMLGPAAPLITAAVRGREDVRRTAQKIVEIVELAIRADKSFRPGGSTN